MKPAMLDEEDALLTFNGLDGSSGGYLFPEMRARALASLALETSSDRRHLLELAASHRRAQSEHLGPKEGVDPKILGEAGWGIVFPAVAEPGIEEALAPLLKHRKEQVGAGDSRRFRVFRKENGVLPGESKGAFLARHGVGPGPADPDRMPYYLLLVGTPEENTFEFQFMLDVQYAVGRLCLDELDHYRSYAESVVAAERSPMAREPRLTLFGPRNESDPATVRSHDQLVTGLDRELRGAVAGWQLGTFTADHARKQDLVSLLGGTDKPTILLTAGHGMGFHSGDRRQRSEQGALICQEWQGPHPAGKPISSDAYVSGCDLDDGGLCPHGLIAFFFACYSGGTPATNSYLHRGPSEVESLAPVPFAARLPERLLAHRNGGALAVIGHVDRAWTISFSWPGVGAEIEVFSSALRRLMSGHPIGSAMEYFNLRYAELSTELSRLRELPEVSIPEPMSLVRMWTAHNDARSYVVFGDPAVRAAETVPENRPAQGSNAGQR